jgi:gamma-glutamyltranspeptidase
MHSVESAQRSSRKPIFGQKGMVVSGHPAASLAGLRVLERGGNVIDAAIAASAALAVLLSHATSIGGDCFALFHDGKTNRTRGLNASGVAPQAATLDKFPTGIPLLGPTAVLVPGLVRAWGQLHEQYGTLQWSSLFEAAISYAEDSAPISSVLAERIVAHRAQILADPGSRQTYLDGEAPVGVGQCLHQPALARTLKSIARNGADEYYVGETAESIASYFAECGGLITKADLAAYQPEWVEPIATMYRGHDVIVMPPNSYGVLLLMQLNGLSAVRSEDLAADAAQRISYQISAMQEAFAQGVDLIADSRRCSGTVAHLLGPEATLSMERAVLKRIRGAQRPDAGGTSCLLVADAEGSAVNIVQSVFHVFGSQFLEPRTGILFNNRMNGFTSTPGKPATVGPRLRPPHTLCPIIVSREGQLRYVLASPGGLSQTLTNVQVINQLLDGGHDVGTAVESPRWCNTMSGELLIEPEFPGDTVEHLRGLGHEVKRQADPYFYGSAKAIEYLPGGVLAGAADQRREAFAVGI